MGVFRRVGIDIDPNALAGSLSVGMQQLVEVAKAIASTPAVIMDEPTSSLSEKDTAELFQVIRDLLTRSRHHIRLAQAFRTLRDRGPNYGSSGRPPDRDGGCGFADAREFDPYDGWPEPRRPLSSPCDGDRRRGLQMREPFAFRRCPRRQLRESDMAKFWVWLAWSGPAAPKRCAPWSMPTTGSSGNFWLDGRPIRLGRPGRGFGPRRRLSLRGPKGKRPIPLL